MMYDGDAWALGPDPLDQLDEVYEERNALVAFLAKLYGSVFVEDSEDCPGWGIVYINTHLGQMSWHIPPRDFHMFDGVSRVESYWWDGHTTEQKYVRLKKLAEDLYK